MKKYKDIIIIGVILVSIIGISIFLDAVMTREDALTIVKKRIGEADRIIVAIGEQNRLKVENKKFIYDYHENKHELVKEITDKDEVKKIVDIINNVEKCPGDDIHLSYYSTLLFQFYKNQRKIAEFNLQKITIGYTTNIVVHINKRDEDELKNYFVDYYNA